ncbi:hypothetical protein niasHT_026673 [Heterodera trifolii]|uniref:Ground-like domain-containing protein n=1 Tax=Heterodera trifolii TaxID=157864 RepID=A0ABD2JSL8_9BILA
MPTNYHKLILIAVFLILPDTAIGADPIKLEVQQSATAEASQTNEQQQAICRPCACVSVPTPPLAAPMPAAQQVIVPPLAQQQQLLQCPPMPPCPVAIPVPMRLPRPPPRPPTFICPPPQQCPPPPVCPRPEPCPVQTPAPQVPLPEPLPALPTFIAPPPQVLRQPPMVPLVVGTQNDCCCNCVQTTCRAMGIAGGRAHGARTTSFGSAIWEELFGGGGEAGPPPPPKMMVATEAKCNSRVLEETILENMFTDLESSKRRIQAVAEQKIGSPISVVCGAYEFSFVVHTDRFCQASRPGMSCYAFSSSASPK